MIFIKELSRLAMWAFLLASPIALAQHTLLWTGTASGDEAAGSYGPSPFNVVSPKHPTATDTAFRAQTGYYPVSSHSHRFIVSSDQLFDSTSSQAHVILALNHEAILSNDYVYPMGWIYAVMGNQFQGLLIGDLGEGPRAYFEAKYEVPCNYYSAFWQQSWFWGVRGTSTAEPESASVGCGASSLSPVQDLSDPIYIPWYINANTGEKEVDVQLDWTASNPGALFATFRSPGQPDQVIVYGGGCTAPGGPSPPACMGDPNGFNEWFYQRLPVNSANPNPDLSTYNVIPLHGGLGIGVVGKLAAGKYVKVVTQ